jgi:hypothetical protein
MTAPTSGFGLTLPSPFRASVRARRMNFSSVERMFSSAMVSASPGLQSIFYNMPMEDVNGFSL